ncbi:fimbrial protein [Pantoea dispersa]|uniref:fimbrial protein n=1 Tax=Pantoea dispersa TaxID=59814 RepID=UPI002DB8483C|nr:fimbrial protein [Pantoea dispersa]MEB5973912.1 fimbrial protein [Pantoea dispersa]
MVQAHAGESWIPYPLKMADRKTASPGPYWLQPGQEVVYDNFMTRNYARMNFIVTKDIVGGAIFIPPNIEITTIYAIIFRSREIPLPPKPDKPLLRIFIGPHGIIIPVPIVCNINNGTDINVEFNRIAVSSVSESGSNTTNGIDVPLEVKCSSSLNQEVNLRLVAGTPSFSDELIATNYPDLGIAVKHKGQLLKPMGTSAVRLINGMASEVITVFPVKKEGQQLSGGEFNASATLLISLP